MKSICWKQHKNYPAQHRAEKIFVFLIVYLTGSTPFLGFFFTLESLWDVQKRGGNLWICSKYAARMHQKSQQLCGQI